jgi:RimJ/RimL family protein N-acetyltransferase
VRSTGPDFREEHELRDGSRIYVRHIRPEDAIELKRGFERLSPTSRYRRFLAGVSSLTEAQLHYLTHVDGEDHVALVATMPDGEREIGLGVARFVRVTDEPHVAEAAITVPDDVHRRGIGKLLAMTLARAALERGIDRFRGEILADNAAARQLLEEVGATIVRDADGNLVFDVALTPQEEKPPQELVARRLLEAASTFVFAALRKLS